MKTVLSTKNLNLTQRKKLLEAGFAVVESSFIEIKSIHFQVNDSYDYLIFTSKNAVKSILNNKNYPALKRISTVCVGSNTKKLLLENGWKVLFSADSAAELGKKIIQKIDPKNTFVFFNGNLRKDVLPEMLTKHCFQLTEIQVYKTQFTPEKIDCVPDAILFFSPSAIKSFLSQNKLPEKALNFSIGESTAQALQSFQNQIIISKNPSIKDVIEDCIKFLKYEIN